MMKHALPWIALLLLAACDSQTGADGRGLKQWIGSEVTVHFNRDALGAAGNPIAPTVTGQNNTMLSIDGKITEVHEDGIFFDGHYRMNTSDTTVEHSIFWVPMHSILTIESRK